MNLCLKHGCFGTILYTCDVFPSGLHDSNSLINDEILIKFYIEITGGLEYCSTI